MFSKVVSALALITALVALGLICFQKEDKVGYVYNSRILNEYKGVLEARMQYQQDLTQWQANLDTITAQLNQEVATFGANQNAMSKNEAALTEELIARKKQELINYKKVLEQKAADRDAEMTKSILNQIDAYVLDYGQKNGYKYLFGVTDAGNILYADEADDVTDAILEQLNHNYESAD